MASPTTTVWFDGDCPLCVREIALIRRLDRAGRIDFVDLSLGEGCVPDRRAMLARFHAQETGGPTMSGAAAFLLMWRAIPSLRPLARLAQAPGVLWLMERAYRGFLRLRPFLQALVRRLERTQAKR